jgi:hypothetical protein
MKLVPGLIIVAALFLGACSNADDESSEPALKDASAIVTESIALASSAAASCVEEYSLTNLANRAFAFDGTVTEIESLEGASPGSTAYALVTFEVHEWFRPDGPNQISVEMNPPGLPSTLASADYAVGTRLLVSGEPRWGGEPLEDPIVWSCGFSRTHSIAAAEDWRESLS